ncbi:MAG: sugar phosphate isomerase/epimerase [Bryobacteraceae bacterium]|nr:sugar phosphate isomerase/epimerase [Bryobacteraceae bacterium]MDW8377780.1 TIM barrel protein [Bryobacterales bacterium]
MPKTDRAQGRRLEDQPAAPVLAVRSLRSQISRRSLIPGLASGLLAGPLQAKTPTKFQLACMTLPYSAFPVERALEGILKAGFRFVAWGVTHRDRHGVRRLMLEEQASPAEAQALAKRCRDLGLEPVMMFATVQLEEANALKVHLRRIEQAAAARIPFLLTFGRTRPGEYETMLRNLKQMAQPAREAGVTVLIKQHGGNTATGEACARIVQEVNSPAVAVCYDAGNVLDYENHDPIPDIQRCWPHVRAFAIKDHRNTPKDEDCGPGFGEIDHYKLFLPVLQTGRTMPLAFENIFEPLVPRPDNPEAIDALARRSREFIETVIRGLLTHERA